MTPAMCWLHSDADVHEVLLLVGVRLPDVMPASVVPAEVRCARQFPIEMVVPATEIDVELVAA